MGTLLSHSSIETRNQNHKTVSIAGKRESVIKNEYKTINLAIAG